MDTQNLELNEHEALSLSVALDMFIKDTRSEASAQTITCREQLQERINMIADALSPDDE
ncbi:MAG: hypothetical protein OXC63_08140 [Aestuariivita sp.]|nr:hypothetical protein [Aestuariivita sp.]MCY4345360.1 hypothetical protein [Aestuariivita sp.]